MKREESTEGCRCDGSGLYRAHMNLKRPRRASRSSSHLGEAWAGWPLKNDAALGSTSSL